MFLNAYVSRNTTEHQPYFTTLTCLLKTCMSSCDMVKNPDFPQHSQLNSDWNFEAIYKKVLSTLQHSSTAHTSAHHRDLPNSARPAPTSRPLLSLWTSIWMPFLLFPTKPMPVHQSLAQVSLASSVILWHEICTYAFPLLNLYWIHCQYHILPCFLSIQTVRNPHFTSPEHLVWH